MARKLMRRSLNTIATPDDPLTIGPENSGCLLTLEQFASAEETPGYVYELIDGVLIVSPNPSPWHDTWVRIVHHALSMFASQHLALANHVSQQADVVIPGRPGPTRPQPDVAVFRDFPRPPPADWAEVCPVVVVEVVSPRRERKDTTRNRQLYWMAGGIEEYWIITPTPTPERPTLIALTRKAGVPEWVETEIPFGKTHRCRALPGFSLNLRRSERSWIERE